MCLSKQFMIGSLSKKSSNQQDYTSVTNDKSKTTNKQPYRPILPRLSTAAFCSTKKNRHDKYANYSNAATADTTVICKPVQMRQQFKPLHCPTGRVVTRVWSLDASLSPRPIMTDHCETTIPSSFGPVTAEAASSSSCCKQSNLKNITNTMIDSTACCDDIISESVCLYICLSSFYMTQEQQHGQEWTESLYNDNATDVQTWDQLFCTSPLNDLPDDAFCFSPLNTSQVCLEDAVQSMGSPNIQQQQQQQQQYAFDDNDSFLPEEEERLRHIDMSLYLQP